MENLNDIISSLTPEDIEALKATAESVFGSGGPAPPPSSQGFGIDPSMFSKLTQVMSAMNSDGGKRCRLIEALKPNLSSDRQKKADEAMQMLRLMEMLPLITNLTDRDE